MDSNKTNRINIYRISQFSSFDDLDFSKKGYQLEHKSDDIKLYIHRGKKTKPAWVDYISTLIKDNHNSILNVSSSFILLKKHSAHIYVITGGYGYTEIRELADEDFGLQIALRMIDENQIANIKQRSLKGNVRQIMRAVAGYDPIFDSDNYNRILDGLEGKVKFEGRQFRVIGRSSLVLRTDRSIEMLNDIFSEIEEYLKLEPKITFPKSYEEVFDTKTIENLNDNLKNYVILFWRSESDRDNIYLEFNDPIAQFRCNEFIIKYNRKSISVEDFDLELIRDKLIEKGADEPSSLEALAKFRVTGINESNISEFENYQFTKLIVYETILNNRYYIRFSNKWFVILEEVQSFIDQELSKIKIEKNLLPAWNKSIHPKEINYNKWVAEQNNWSCLDSDLIYLPGRSKIEVCDIYDSESKKFIHVKETWGSKAAYLFSQGVISAEFYINSVLFRDKCEEKWPGLIPSYGSKEKITIVFGIADEKSMDSNFPINLSYFAKLSCYNAVVSLRAHGFDVSLAPINILPKII